MNVNDFAAAAEAAGWTSAGEDRDVYGGYRSAAWRNSSGAQIIHVATDRSPAQTNIVDRVVVSTTDDLGWAASQIGQWSSAAGNLDEALRYLRSNGKGS